MQSITNSSLLSRSPIKPIPAFKDRSLANIVKSDKSEAQDFSSLDSKALSDPNQDLSQLFTLEKALETLHAND